MDPFMRLGMHSFIGICLVSLGVTAWNMSEEMKANAARTPVQKFAVENLEDCTRAKGLFDSGKSKVECINIVVNAARTVKGEQFASDVARELGNPAERDK